jgi:hypothetical protein
VDVVEDEDGRFSDGCPRTGHVLEGRGRARPAAVVTTVVAELPGEADRVQRGGDPPEQPARALRAVERDPGERPLVAFHPL